jgi:kinesin family member 3B
VSGLCRFHPPLPSLDRCCLTLVCISVFPADCKQRDLYEDSGYPIVEAALGGFNGTIFAYGQTGTGKTWTMQGVPNDEHLRGIIPNSFQHIFDHVTLAKEGTTFSLRASYLEIYNENIRDLLVKVPKGAKPTYLELREGDNGVFVDKIQWFEVGSVEEIDTLMEKGFGNRTVAETKMNAESSRSHSIFTIIVESSEEGDDGKQHVKAGRLNLVDLAGSERQSKTGASGATLVEAAKINLSLTALGNVISSLVDGKSKHIPYRDSKLTRMLQDSLGGNAKTVMVANLGPADYNYDETLSTLRYANRAKQIKNKPKINEDPKDAMLRELADQLNMLKAQLGDGANGSLEPRVEVEERVEVIRRAVARSGVDPALIDQLKNEKDEAIRAALEKAGANQNAIEEASAELEAAAAEAERIAQEKKAMAEKIQRMKKQVKKGGNLEDQNSKQAAEIRRRENMLKQQKLEEERLQRELKQKEEAAADHQEKFSSLQEEADHKGMLVEKAMAKYQEAKQDAEDVFGEWEREKEELLDSVRELTQQIELRRTIVKHFIPPEEEMQLKDRAQWDKESEQWLLAHRAFATTDGEKTETESDDKKRRPAKTVRPPSSVGDGRLLSDFNKSERFRLENVIDLELYMPERTTYDYEHNDSQDIGDVMKQALADEEGDVVLITAEQNLPGMAPRSSTPIDSDSDDDSAANSAPRKTPSNSSSGSHRSERGSRNTRAGPSSSRHARGDRRQGRRKKEEPDDDIPRARGLVSKQMGRY